MKIIHPKNTKDSQIHIFLYKGATFAFRIIPFAPSDSTSPHFCSIEKYPTQRINKDILVFPKDYNLDIDLVILMDTVEKISVTKLFIHITKKPIRESSYYINQLYKKRAGLVENYKLNLI